MNTSTVIIIITIIICITIVLVIVVVTGISIGIVNIAATNTSVNTVETYDKKWHFSVLEYGNFLFPAGYIHSFGRGIRFSGLNCSIPTSRGRKSRVSISYRRISYRMSPPYKFLFLSCAFLVFL